MKRLFEMFAEINGEMKKQIERREGINPKVFEDFRKIPLEVIEIYDDKVETDYIHYGIVEERSFYCAMLKVNWQMLKKLIDATSIDGALRIISSYNYKEKAILLQKIEALRISTINKNKKIKEIKEEKEILNG